MLASGSSSPAVTASSNVIREWLAIARYHIILIAMTAMVTFSWLLTGRYAFGLTVFVAVDWFLINLLNRITDIQEDLLNGIPGTERVQRQQRALILLSGLLFVGSFAASTALYPLALLPLRIVVQLIGAGYNYRIVPCPRFLRAGLVVNAPALALGRFKEMYFFKNFMSAVIFVFTGFLYPLAITGGLSANPTALAMLLWLIAFFLPFEISYEILYDLRDLAGDRQEAIPTYPVVHGEQASRRIIDSLLITSCVVVLSGFALRVFGVRELLFLAAPIAQWFFYRARIKRGLTSRDCIGLTHLGSVQLALFLVGTFVWNLCKLPTNIYW